MSVYKHAKVAVSWRSNNNFHFICDDCLSDKVSEIIKEVDEFVLKMVNSLLDTNFINSRLASSLLKPP